MPLKQTGTLGQDGLDGKILKLSVPLISDTLTYVYKLCIGCNYVQGAFKRTKVIPQFKSERKKKKSSDLSNYKPISVLIVL